MNLESSRKEFGSIIREKRKAKGPNWTQERLSKELNKVLDGKTKVRFCQERISRLERGEVSLRLTDDVIIALQKVLNISDESLESLKKGLNTINEEQHRIPSVSISQGNYLAISSNEAVLFPYIGEYYCVFFSTDSDELRPINGKLTISFNRESLCQGDLTILNHKGETIKTYSGPVAVNTHYRTWHCILVGQEKQEICTMISTHFNCTIHKNLFNVALVLTTSSGTQKRPTVHRMLISRNKMIGENLRLVLAQLRLNNDMVCLSEDSIKRIKKDIQSKLYKVKSNKVKQKYTAVLDCINLIETHGKKETYYRMDEAALYDTQMVSSSKLLRSYAVSLLRSYSETPYYNKINDTVNSICSDIIGKPRRE